MSEATTEATTEAVVIPVIPEAATADLGDAGKKAIDAERRRATVAEKQAKEFKARLDALDAEKLSDVEKANKAALDAQQKLAEYERTMLRQKVALDKGVPPTLVDRLRGDTEDEVAADADALLALLSAPRTPKPDPSQGSPSVLGPLEQSDPRSLITAGLAQSARPSQR